MKKKYIFIIFAIFFLVSAIYHLVAIFFKINTSPLLRNLLFTVINLLVAYGLLKRPRYFIYLFALLMVQQLYSHFTDLYNLWSIQHKIDWISLLVIVVMPTIFIFLLLDKLGRLKQ